VFYALGQSDGLDADVRKWLGAVRQQARSGVVAPTGAQDVTHLLDEMRLFKDATELDTMRRAALISAQAHCHAMAVAVPGGHEYEVEAELLYHFRRHASQFPAYGSIVASGASACVLHYRANDQVLHDGDLLLIDAGCELDGYASDITRTFPVNGRFSAAQRDCYEVVLAAQAAAIAVTCPGQTFMAPHDAAVKVLAQGMLDLKLLTGSLDQVLETGSYKRFYMHRTGHWLGMDVHDCGDYREPGPMPAGTEKPWRLLRPGMVLTVEPGLYIRPGADVPEAFWNIGIRIEDDAVVTEQGCEILTDAVPKSVAGIESLIAQRRAERALA
jgi:Xaa-Pro aminopeptidase